MGTIGDYVARHAAELAEEVLAGTDIVIADSARQILLGLVGQLEEAPIALPHRTRPNGIGLHDAFC